MSEKFIHLAEPCLGGNEWLYVKQCLDEGWISSVGPFVDRLERAVAETVGIPYAVGVVNGTAALHAALLTIGLRPEEEVIVPNLTFIAPVNAICYAGAHPILMDADIKNWQIDVEKVAQFLKEECEQKMEGCFNRKTKRRVRAILPVHLLGFSCEMDRICALAQEYGLKVVEDAAEGMGVRYQGRHVGTFGDIGIFSFNGNKVISAGSGGMIMTHNRQYADYARYLTTQAKNDALEYIHNEIGFNYRLSNIHAAIGLAQLERLDEFLVKKRAIACFYKEALGSIKGITLMPEPPDCSPSFWLYTILLDDRMTLERRREMIKELNARGIGARSFWHTIHNLPPYKKAQSYQIQHSIRLYERGVCLPSSVHLKKDDLQRVVSIFKQVLNG